MTRWPTSRYFLPLLQVQDTTPKSAPRTSNTSTVTTTIDLEIQNHSPVLRVFRGVTSTTMSAAPTNTRAISDETGQAPGKSRPKDGDSVSARHSTATNHEDLHSALNTCVLCSRVIVTISRSSTPTTGDDPTSTPSSSVLDSAAIVPASECRGGESSVERYDTTADNDEPDPGHSPPLDSDEIIIASEGHSDLHLVLTATSGEVSRRYTVNAGCFCHASPAWTRIYDSRTEDSNVLELAVPSDHIDWIDRALHLAHFRNHEIGNHFTFNQLTQLAEVCERYGLLDLFHPYLLGWVSPWLSKICKPGYEMWILLAYAFGYREIFETCSEQLALNMYLQDGAFWIGDNPDIVSKMGESIKDNLIRLRERYIDSTITTCYERIDGYSGDEEGLEWTNLCPECRAMALGYLLRGLRRYGLWPNRPEAKGISDTVTTLRDSIFSIDHCTLHSSEDGPDDAFRPDCHEISLPVCETWDASYIKAITPGSECDRHFKELPVRILQTAPAVWEHAMITTTAMRESDLRSYAPCGRKRFDYSHQSETEVEQDSRYPNSDSDEEYLTEPDLSEPEEEYLNFEEASNYGSCDDEASTDSTDS
ncbi:hypothetical protein BDV96DRAFT_234699 [Lophiotrema nucula]|uniref:BTB domain-containing protein n=1 Tax=Lophiotrema nucula TaxID=690887 RepID=A0A6A5YQ34_9PLEO|nr:hypothetical protein BDV96DRAFT_234699 [Lophiotrema nucula]